MNDDEMNALQVADRLGITRHRVYALHHDGQLPGESRKSEVGTCYFVFKRVDVERLAEERRQIAAKEKPPRGGTRPRMPPEKKG